MTAKRSPVCIRTTPRRQRAAVTVALGLSAGAVGWSGLAQAASEETTSQMMLLPEHYELMDNGVVVFKLETGENLSLTADQYLILQDGLLLITDELAQASVYSLPVMGSVRAQLLSDLEQGATIDGTVAEATPTQTLAITEGQAPRLSEQVELQSYEVAQSSGDNNNSNAAGDALAASIAFAPGGMVLAAMLATSDRPEAPEAEAEPTPYTGPARGFVINGIDANDDSGYSVSSAGDINKDGYDDVIIGAFLADPNGNDSGESYVVFGKAAGYSASLELSALDGTNGFAIDGIDVNDQSGLSVSSAGDINNDGYDDIIIGAFLADPNGNDSGECYVVFGKAAGYSPSLNLSSLLAGDGSAGFVINGIDVNDQSGLSVSSAGDINKDGFDDIIIGASLADPNGNDSGESYVVFGKAAGYSASLELKSLLATNGGDGSAGFVINGIDVNDQSGLSVSSAGDINNDGYDDIIIGALYADPNGDRSGESYVVFGKAAGYSDSLELSSLLAPNGGDGSAGFVINGIAAWDHSGLSVSSAGDINNDGYDDIIIGAPFADPNGDRSGESYVVFGKAAGYSASLELSALDGTNGFVINGIDAIDYSGYSMSSAGDINNDGYDDIIIGAFLADPNGDQSGESYVVFGKAAGYSASLDLSSLDGTNGFVINGIDANDSSGRSVSSAGDINNDGYDDIIIGAFGGDPNSASDAGESYVVFGQSEFDAFVNLADLAILG